MAQIIRQTTTTPTTTTPATPPPWAERDRRRRSPWQVDQVVTTSETYVGVDHVVTGRHLYYYEGDFVARRRRVRRRRTIVFGEAHVGFDR